MKAIFCTFCGAMTPLNKFKIAECDCGRCLGRYLEPFGSGISVFTERNVKQPKYLWVIGIINTFFPQRKGEKEYKPDYTAYESTFLEFDKGKTFYDFKSNIIAIRPKSHTLVQALKSINASCQTDSIFIKETKFYSY